MCSRLQGFKLKMHLKATLINALSLGVYANSKTLSKEEKLREIEKARLSPEELKKLENLHTTWYLQAVEGLLGAYGRKLYRSMH
uniref:Sod_Fe_N domain-containing protein n=1 Tax=Steinernema glaseri TaxID=37863 RepID=A0A1I7Y446_9BILA